MATIKISDISGREILDSRGNPTVEAEVTLHDGSSAIASVPSGASTGKKEAWELRDNETRYLGLGVLKAVSNVNTVIRNTLVDSKCEDQIALDQCLINLDGTKYEGEWKDGKIHGIGKMIFSNGNIYEGLWIDDQYHNTERDTMKKINGILMKGKYFMIPTTMVCGKK